MVMKITAEKGEEWRVKPKRLPAITGWLLVAVAGFLLAAPHHLSESLGNEWFELLGVPEEIPTDGGGRFQLPQIVGVALMISGLIGANKAYIQERRKNGSLLIRGIGGWLVAGVAIAAGVYPFLTEKAIVGLYYFADGPRSVAYNAEQSDCRIAVDEPSGEWEADCTFVIYNYGRANAVSVVPVLTGLSDVPLPAAPLNPKAAVLRPHSKNRVHLSYSAPSKAGEQRIFWSGGLGGTDAELKINPSGVSVFKAHGRRPL